jgi:hypothetical protein
MGPRGPAGGQGRDHPAQEKAAHFPLRESARLYRLLRRSALLAAELDRACRLSKEGWYVFRKPSGRGGDGCGPLIAIACGSGSGRALGQRRGGVTARRLAAVLAALIGAFRPAIGAGPIFAPRNR